MTKKRFYKLRYALLVELHKDAKAHGYDSKKTHYDIGCVKCKPDLTQCGSYAGAWEMLKPLRDALNFKGGM